MNYDSWKTTHPEFYEVDPPDRFPEIREALVKLGLEREQMDEDIRRILWRNYDARIEDIIQYFIDTINDYDDL